jgi:hypothetical protein
MILPLDDAVVAFDAQSLRNAAQGKGRKR